MVLTHLGSGAISRIPDMNAYTCYAPCISLQQTFSTPKNKFLYKNNHFEPMFIKTII